MSERYYDDGPPASCLWLFLAVLSAGLSLGLYAALLFFTRPF